MKLNITQAEGSILPERIYVAAAVLKEFRGRENVEMQLFRPGAPIEEARELERFNPIGDPPADMPAEVLAGATREAALACLLECFTFAEIEKLAAYLQERYPDHIVELAACPMDLPAPLGLGPLGAIPESETSGFINFDQAPDYPLDFKFKGFYDLSAS